MRENGFHGKAARAGTATTIGAAARASGSPFPPEE